MTVIVSKPAVNLREELASLRNQGGYQEQQFYFESLVTNGGFDTDTNWTKQTGWTISGGTANSNNASGYTDINQSVSVVVGVRYRLDFSITAYTSGAVAPYLGASGSSDANFTGGTLNNSIAAGIGDYYGFCTFTSGEPTSLLFRANNGFIGSIDNVSLTSELGITWDSSNNQVYRMPKGWVPKDVYEDGLLQREGSAHDYEVVYDGFDYYVKPTVAPSATTQTCVIGVKA